MMRCEDTIRCRLLSLKRALVHIGHGATRGKEGWRRPWKLRGSVKRGEERTSSHRLVPPLSVLIPEGDGIKVFFGSA
jgi:hypothetical protein